MDYTLAHRRRPRIPTDILRDNEIDLSIELQDLMDEIATRLARVHVVRRVLATCIELEIRERAA